MPELRQVVIVSETEAAACARLVAHGYPADIAAEISVYLAQATDLPEHAADMAAALAQAGTGVDFVTLDDLPALVPRLAVAGGETIMWNQTDGIRFYRGSTVPALARLLGVARYGSPATAQHLCQDKFATLCLAESAGLRCPPTLLLEGADRVASLGRFAWSDSPLFVKPNTIGAKIGIFSDSRCEGLAQARALASRLWLRYGDRALVQPYIDGDDVRVSFMDTGGGFREQLGIFSLAKDPAGEVGGAFMTMHDNATLSGARDTEGGRGGFGATRPAAFVPRMADLRAEGAACVADIETAAARLVRLAGLSDYFSIDFRLDAAGDATFLEFEVCPAVTIYDFQDYLRRTHRLDLGTALARSLRRAHGRWQTRAQA